MSGCSSSSGSKGAAKGGGGVAGSVNAISETTVTDTQLLSEMSKRSNLLEAEVRRLSKVKRDMERNGQNIDNINTELRNTINAAKVATIGYANENQTLRNISNMNNDLSAYKWTPEKIQKTQNAAAKMILDKQNEGINELMIASKVPQAQKNIIKTKLDAAEKKYNNAVKNNQKNEYIKALEERSKLMRELYIKG